MGGKPPFTWCPLLLVWRLPIQLPPLRIQYSNNIASVMGAVWCWRSAPRPPRTPPNPPCDPQLGLPGKDNARGANKPRPLYPALFKAWKGLGRKPGLCTIPPSCSCVTELGSSLSALVKHPAPCNSPHCSVSSCSRARWLMLPLPKPRSALRCGGGEMLQQSILCISLPFAIPAPSSASLGQLLPTLQLPPQCCGVHLPQRASSPSLPVAACLWFCHF